MINSDNLFCETRANSPSLEKWRELYESAIEFKMLEPWNWMEDTDLFGIQNPDSGEIGYCCVLGAYREFFGLAVYLGTEGLNTYLKLQSGRMNKEKDAFKILLTKKCLVASFEDKRYLSKEDIKVIKELSLVFHGPCAWPQFRNYEPGYFPWYLTEEEAIYLTLCLKQAYHIALRFKSNPNMLVSSKKKLYFVRAPKKEGDNIEWTDAWLEPIPLKETVRTTGKIDKERIQKISRTVSHTEMIWEIDSFYTLQCVQENKGERPFYPVTFMCVDQASDFVLGVHLTPKHREEEEFIEYFLDTVEKNGLLPAKLLVRNKEFLPLVKPLTEIFNIELESVKTLSAVNKARRSMLEFFTRSG